MANFGRNAPPIAVVLASLVLWSSLAWGLPAEAAVEGEVAPAERAPSEPAAEPRKWTGWFYAGLGFGSHEFAAGAGVNVKYLRFLGTLRGTFMGTVSGGFFGPGEEVYDVGLLFGYNPLGSLSIAAGVAKVGGKRYYGGGLGGPWRPTEYFDVVGVPLEVQFTPVKSRVVGLGIVAHVNINSEESFGGVTVGIELGKLK